MNEFNVGPFLISPAARSMTVAGKPCRRWTISYAGEDISMRTLAEGLTQSQVYDEFLPDVAAFTVRVRAAAASDKIELIDYETGEAVAHFFSDDMCGMTPGLIDDRSRYWIRSADRLYSRSVTLSDYANLVAGHAELPNAWIASLLPNEILTNEPDKWRAPTSWEIRHVAGVGSFIGSSGASAAKLVGVTDSNFRKYTAREGAKTRQPISFAMWHLLLHKLGVKRA